MIILYVLHQTSNKKITDKSNELAKDVLTHNT